MEINELVVKYWLNQPVIKKGKHSAVHIPKFRNLSLSGLPFVMLGFCFLTEKERIMAGQYWACDRPHSDDSTGIRLIIRKSLRCSTII